MEEKYIEPDVLRVVKRNKNNEEFEKINNRSPKYEKNLNNKKANNSKKTIRGPKAENTRYKGKKGLRNRFISLVLAATAVLGMGTTAVGIEDYNDKNEKIIATVQDVENDKFKDSAPAKIDWNQRKKVTSVELVDGKYYEVSSNSIVFVQEDKIRPGNKKNDVIILTEDGLVEGKMVGEYLQETPYQLNKEAKEKYVNTYMVTADSEATLMSSNGNEIMQILPGEYILASSLEKKDQNGNAVLDVLYVNENTMSYGFVKKELLKEIDIVEEVKQEEVKKENIMRVETENGIGLNCRSSAEIIENNIIEKIPSGETVSLTGINKSDAQRTWVQIEYQNKDGKIVTGWVDNSYLREIGKSDYYTPNITSKELKEIINSVQLNDEGSVTGIDSLGITINQIEKLNSTGITENIIKSDIFKGQNINISEINGNINFMYIRIGGMGYGKEFRTLENDYYKEQVKKCEELGIPYGFYYYSTSVTEEEANIEYQNIEKDFEDLGSLKYNLLPLAIDVELGGEGDITRDRQYGNDVTGAKAYLTNKLQNNLGFDIMLYTSGSCTLSTTEAANILDLEEYNRLTGVENVWMPMPKQENGEVGQAYKDYLSRFPKCMNLIMEQEVLDTTISNGAKIDINTISKSDYILMLKKVLEKVETRENNAKQKVSTMEYEL